ncbi:hypothetical protein [Streptomyces sp. NPDC056948]|uniref:hypothetical protein n=1 Tax=Streptomyces sp. NPDC056948 TaxID=3345975 RepID=UPI0036267B1C
MAVPDPQASAAVLVGIDSYTQDPTVWGLPDDHVSVLGADASAADVLGAVRGAAKGGTHSARLLRRARPAGPRRAASPRPGDADADHPQIGSLPYLSLREVLRRAGYRARFHICVLNCRYSGLASATAPSRADLARAHDEPPLPQDDASACGGCAVPSRGSRVCTYWCRRGCRRLYPRQPTYSEQSRSAAVVRPLDLAHGGTAHLFSRSDAGAQGESAAAPRTILVALGHPRKLNRT